MKIKRAEIWASAAAPSGFPQPESPEVAFLGRSNVGKSSLLNKLVGRRQLAYTSSTPGKTRLVHFYRVLRMHDALAFVDLPGYGYARVSRKERNRWKPLVEGYLDSDRPIALAVLLQDARREPGEDEALLLSWLDERNIATLVVPTKVDKLKRSQRAKAVAAIARSLSVAADTCIATSAQSGDGLDALWKAIDRRVRSAQPGDD